MPTSSRVVLLSFRSIGLVDGLGHPHFGAAALHAAAYLLAMLSAPLVPEASFSVSSGGVASDELSEALRGAMQGPGGLSCGREASLRRLARFLDDCPPGLSSPEALRVSAVMAFAFRRGLSRDYAATILSSMPDLPEDLSGLEQAMSRNGFSLWEGSE